jgi:hypothetical protein
MKFLLISVLSFVSSLALADGFTCLTRGGDLQIQVLNNTSKSRGTRTASIMILSDPTVAEGYQTISRFSAQDGTLETDHATADGLLYSATVDLRFSESGAAGEYLLGTRLGEVDGLILKIDFTYGDNLKNGESTKGFVKVIKHNGDEIKRFATCTRYLKSSRVAL